jgi:hypothetical protein
LDHSNELLHATLAFWQRRCRQRLTDEDARQILENTCGFYGVLASWHRCAAGSSLAGTDASAEPQISECEPQETQPSGFQRWNESSNAGTPDLELEKPE